MKKLFFIGLLIIVGFVATLMWRSFLVPKTQCLQREVSLGYPYKEYASYEPTPIPNFNWQLMVENMPARHASIVQMVATKNGDIWMNQPLLRLEANTNQISLIEPSYEEPGGFGVDSMVISDSGDLWILGTIYGAGETTHPYLGIFDLELDQFVRKSMPDLVDLFDLGFRDLAAGPNGNIWILYGGYIFLYSPGEERVIDQLDRTNDLDLSQTSIVAANDQPEKLFFIAKPRDKYSQNGTGFSSEFRMFMYSSKTKTLTRYDSMPELTEPSFPTLFLDSSRRLWVGDYSWLQLDDDLSRGSWFEVIRSATFITDYPIGQYQYIWDRPRDIQETKDGDIWFVSEAGLVRLDSKTDEWCLVFSEPVYAMLDFENKIWIATEDQIFRQN